MSPNYRGRLHTLLALFLCHRTFKKRLPISNGCDGDDAHYHYLHPLTAHWQLEDTLRIHKAFGVALVLHITRVLQPPTPET